MRRENSGGHTKVINWALYIGDERLRVLRIIPFALLGRYNTVLQGLNGANFEDKSCYCQLGSGTSQHQIHTDENGARELLH